MSSSPTGSDAAQIAADGMVFGVLYGALGSALCAVLAERLIEHGSEDMHDRSDTDLVLLSVTGQMLGLPPGDEVTQMVLDRVIELQREVDVP